MMESITNNVAALTLFATFLLLITFYYTMLNRRMLEISSRPTILIEPKEIYLTPDLNSKCNIDALNKSIEGKRIWFHIKLEIANLGNSPAQDVFLDAKAYFITRKPFRNLWLPIDKPKHFSFMSSQEKILFTFFSMLLTYKFNSRFAIMQLRTLNYHMHIFFL